ncbi:hypothetical protein ACFDA4_09635 [Staphylococcus epidermidis]|uniref:hypothetical protein n=1 Tax=Staphylococcus epidermidis TaxID=1282 RepID=UPI001FEE5DE4|nr:hypothetical protein [Staphylococcus epidermidis]MBE7304047.1 hypothetical protein [Staphylococcus epidermidis]MCG1162622.1 hypothetical protein [Staphylococcus epidermidis]MCG1439446.1 hypothetical protein [Staphylococcus epidermidis]MCG1753211.1 hypothetical protein [Staphylococcus epidermidis]MCG1846971.1 hypothetical protein [Staphylococcus epidermidis]
MLSITDLRKKSKELNQEELIIDFENALDLEWQRAKTLFENKDYISLKFRVFYLYDEIKEYIHEKDSMLNNSFYSLYSYRLKNNNHYHNDSFNNVKDILNLFSDIKNKLDNIESKSLTKKHNFSEKNEITKKISEDIESAEFELC